MPRPGRATAKILALIACLQCFVVSGSLAAGADQAPEADWPTRAWPVSSPEQHGMKSGVLARLVETVGGYKQNSLLIVRHGKIVLDAYYAPYLPNITHDVRSVTKSVLSTLTAIAIRSGQFDGVEQPVMDMFSDKQIPDIDDNKKAITVQHLLDMTSGIAWQEKSFTPDEAIVRMYQVPDRTAFVLSQPMSDAPGAKFYYNSGNPYVLSALINRKTGQNAFEFAKKELFGPLGITSAGWGRADSQGVIDGGAGLSLAPQDMARIGYLYLRNGIWEGKQIIPSSWVDRAREGKTPATFGFHYANLWWSLPEMDAFMAQGRHSQLILVLPKLDIVAVMTGILRDDQFYPMRRLVDDIASAVKSDGPLPPDAVGASLLEASVREAATERPSSVGITPELVKQISGKAYQFSANALKVKTFALNLIDPDPFWEITTETENADRPTRRFSGILGLHGIFRMSPPANYGINASKGRWLDERTFALERRILGHSETQLWVLAFDGNKVEVSFEDTDGSKAKLYGEKKD